MIAISTTGIGKQASRVFGYHIETGIAELVAVKTISNNDIPNQIRLQNFSNQKRILVLSWNGLYAYD
jgi:hypothetical protein